jgi:hypothetical protein
MKQRQRLPGMLVLDRKGEYLADTIDQRGNTVYGLLHHPNAPLRMVVVSNKPEWEGLAGKGRIRAHLPPRFSIRDIDPVDLADFLPGLTPQQANLLCAYSHTEQFYEKLLAENQFGHTDKRNWYQFFPGLFGLKERGKQRLKVFEKTAQKDGRDHLTEEESAELEEHSSARDAEVLERAAAKVKRFCLNPYFGGTAQGRQILLTKSCAAEILKYLGEGCVVIIDMRGRSDDEYTLVGALFARKLLAENKRREDAEQVRACLVLEEAHNILAEEELGKGNGRGSVFIELAREGRSYKLGFVLVTQQPDARSIAPQVVKTIDTVVAFHMPPDDAKHLQRLKAGFAGLELAVSNAPEFHGIALADAGPVFFESEPVGPAYMRACADGSLDERVVARGQADADADGAAVEVAPTLEDRLSALMRQRQQDIAPVLDSLHAWQDDGEVDDDPPPAPTSPPSKKG